MATDSLPDEAEKPKKLFDKVITATPVLLTVIATFLVGQSTSEMTRAQYFRSLAGQNQAKAGDQWALFQSKRARGQTQEMAALLLLAQNRTIFTRTTFLDVARGTVQELKAAEANARADNLTARADDLKPLIPKAEKLLEQTKTLFASSVTFPHSSNVQAALDTLVQPKKKTASPEKSVAIKTTSDGEEASETTEGQSQILKSVIDDVKQKKPESEIKKRVIELTDPALDKAIADAERHASEVNERGKAVETVFDEFDVLREKQRELFGEYQQIADRYVPINFTGEANALSRHTEALRLLNARLQGDYMAARLLYGARRYENEARSNQESAYLYEVKVQLNSARSDKHLYRSKMFMFAMLAAQAGVAISSLALAVQRKSVFWLLATLTGLVAIALGTYIFLDLGPMPTWIGNPAAE